MRKHLVFGLLAVLGALLVSGACAEPPAGLRVDPILFKINLDPQFELRGGVLTLKEYNNNAPPGAARFRVLWSAPLGAQLLRFVLDSAAGDATLKDDGGHVLWVEHFTVPSLTLDFSQAGQAKLTDEAGQTLWTGPWDGKRTGRSGSPGRVTCNGFALVSPKGADARLEDSRGQLLWTGPEQKGEGLYVVDNGQRRPLAWHSTPFPVGEKLSYDIANVPETVTVVDENQAALGTQTVPTIQITKRYSQGYNATHPIISQITPAVMPRPLVAGAYAVTFRDKDGHLVQSQTLDISLVQMTDLAGGRQLESAHYHEITRNAQGVVTEDNAGTTSGELLAASGGI